jgi:hypothetical protein
MKKFALLLLALSLMSGCTMTNEDEVRYDIYKTTYQSILNTTVFKSSSQNFAISATLSDLGNGNIRYDVFIDDPKIAMYDIEILAIVDNGLLIVSDTMMPSVGIFEDVEYNLIPYQINTERGYQKGFNLNGITDSPKVTLKVLVTWKDYFKIKSYKETFQFDLSQN